MVSNNDLTALTLKMASRTGSYTSNAQQDTAQGSRPARLLCPHMHNAIAGNAAAASLFDGLSVRVPLHDAGELRHDWPTARFARCSLPLCLIIATRCGIQSALTQHVQHDVVCGKKPHRVGRALGFISFALRAKILHCMMAVGVKQGAVRSPAAQRLRLTPKAANSDCSMLQQHCRRRSGVQPSPAGQHGCEGHGTQWQQHSPEQCCGTVWHRSWAPGERSRQLPVAECVCAATADRPMRRRLVIRLCMVALGCCVARH